MPPQKPVPWRTVLREASHANPGSWFCLLATFPCPVAFLIAGQDAIARPGLGIALMFEYPKTLDQYRIEGTRQQAAVLLRAEQCLEYTIYLGVYAVFNGGLCRADIGM